MPFRHKKACLASAKQAYPWYRGGYFELKVDTDYNLITVDTTRLIYLSVNQKKGWAQMKKQNAIIVEDRRNLVKRGGRWYIRAMVAGTIVFKSTGTDNIFVAMSMRDELLNPLKCRSDEKALLTSVKRQLEGISAEEERERKENKKGIPLALAWSKFESDPARRDSSDSTMTNHRANWRFFQMWMERNHPGCVFCDDVSPEIAIEFAAYVRDNSRTMNTMNKRISTVKFVFTCLADWDSRISNPFSRIKKKKETDNAGKEPFSDDELKAIFSLPDTEFCRLCAIGLYTSLRLSDAVSLTWEQIYGGYIHATHHKTGSIADMLIPSQLQFWLDTVPNESRHGKVCPTYGNMIKCRVVHEVQSMLQAAGIQTTKVVKCLGGTRIATVKGFHSFRHTAITMALQNGATVAQVKRLAGHASEAMQERYTHLGADDAGKAASVIPAYIPNQEVVQSSMVL